jgi:copper transport protein
MKFAGRRALALLVILIWLALPAGTALAHAQLVSSIPAAGQALPRFPSSFQLDFSEAVDLASARANLINASGEIVTAGKIRIGPFSNRTLYVDLPAQPDGVYSLSWSVNSAVDGHETSGSIGFSVGANTPRASLLPPPGAPDPAADLPPAAELILRGLAYMTTALALGAAAFAMLVWRPAYQVVQQPVTPGDAAGAVKSGELGEETSLNQRLDERVTGLLKGLILAGSIGVIFSMAAVLIWQSLQITADQSTPVWQTLLNNFGHHEGQFFWIRLLALPLMAVLSTLLPPAGRGATRPWWEIVGLGLIVELTYSLSGHNATLDSPFPIVSDWLHFTAMSFWIGGLVPLGAVLLHRRFRIQATDSMQPSDSNESVALLNRVSHRFSRVALTCVIILGLSGLTEALLQVRTLPALLGTRYGQTILLKSGLFALLIGLGALNQLGILPHIARRGGQALRRLGQSVRVEIILGGLVLLAAGGLVSLAPAYQALQADQRTGLHERWQGDGVSMDFRVAPVQVGDNEFGVDIIDSRSGADKVTGTALLRIQAADGSTGQTQVEAKLATSHRYTARGSYLSKMSAWEVQVIWRKSGFDDVTHVFPVDLVSWAEQTGQKVNPVPPNPASIDDGHTLYLANCAPCHGISGKGDGPSGRTLNPAPADLTQHAVPGVHTDGQLFDWITNGYPGSAMPAFKDQLTDKQRWNLVNFMRTLAK